MSAAPTSSSPASTVSLNEIGTEMIRPSNSGIATAIATSTGDNPILDPSHAARGVVAQTAWITGTSRAASEPGSHESL